MTIICSCYEHDGIFQWGDYIVKSTEDLEKILENKELSYPTVVFWMGANNVTGEIFPIQKIGKICHKFNAFYICDATALFSHEYIPCEIEKYCDGFIVDGHKVGTEIGHGFVWLSDNFYKAIEKNLKHMGTPNLKEAIILRDIVEHYSDKEIASEKIYEHYLLYKLLELLKENKIGFHVIAREKHKTEAINAIQLLGLNAQALQNYLCSQNIFIGIGQSSCADKEDNRILCEGYGLSPKDASEVIRISFNRNNFEGEIVELVQKIKKFKEEYCKDESN